MIVGSCDTARRILIVAEAGVNHEGDVARATRMIDEAARAGADAIKFQTYRTDRLLMREETQRVVQRRAFELSNEQFAQLAAHCRHTNMMFLSTPFDEESVEALIPLVPAFKVASVDLTNHRLIAALLTTGKPLILSCGMSADATIQATLRFIERQVGEAFLKSSLALLHCVSSYPAPPEQMNLRSIPYLAQRYGLEVGYSDHASGIFMSLAAAALGARLIEKHFTLDKRMSGIRDHQLSADPTDLRALVEGVRQIESALGVPGKDIAPAERSNLCAMRRGLVAAERIEQGQPLTPRNVELLLPCKGIPAEHYFATLGKSVARTIQAGEPIRPGDLR